MVRPLSEKESGREGLHRKRDRDTDTDTEFEEEEEEDGDGLALKVIFGLCLKELDFNLNACCAVG